MPIHDWTRVPDGIFHHFHHEWISSLCRSLNNGLLPANYYALDEQTAAGFGPDVLTLQTVDAGSGQANESPGGDATTATLVRPKTRYTAQTDGEFYRRKKSSIVVRHVSDDRIVAVIEIISPGNKASRNGFRSLIEKACEFLEHKINLLLIDLFPPTRRDPQGLHVAIWEEIRPETGRSEDGFVPSAAKPLTLVAYESNLVVKAHIEPVAVGDELPDMPLILEPDGAILVPLEATYRTAYEAFPRRWRHVLETGPKVNSSNEPS
jgi:hypothetical protein